MSEWKQVNLGELLEVKYGKAHKALNVGNIPCIGSGGLMRYVDEYLYDDESILIPRKGSLNNIMYQNNPFWTVDTMFWTIINKELVVPKFLFYQLTLIDYENLNVGSAVPSLTVPVINEIEISLPPLPEQKSIASVLSSLDDKIDLLHRQNATLEKMAETLFRQWFVERCPEPVEGEEKEEWEEVELGNLIDVVIDNRGKTPPTVEYPTDYPLIEVNALNSDSCLVDYSVIRKYVSKDTFETWFRKHLEINDIIISTVGTIGVFSIHLVDKGCIAQNLVGLRSNKISVYFLYNFLKSNKETLINLDIGGVQPSIKVPHLLGLTLKLPEIELINKYDESVKIYFDKIATNQTQIRTLTSLRNTLLPKLMSGEVRVEM